MFLWAAHPMSPLFPPPLDARVVPLWGQRLKRILPEAAYYEISPAGCVPAALAWGALEAACCSGLRAWRGWAVAVGRSEGRYRLSRATDHCDALASGPLRRHCPHHERPELTNILIEGALSLECPVSSSHLQLMCTQSSHCGFPPLVTSLKPLACPGWIDSIEHGSPLPLADGSEISVDVERAGAAPLHVAARMVDGTPRNPFEKAREMVLRSKRHHVTYSGPPLLFARSPCPSNHSLSLLADSLPEPSEFLCRRAG